MNRERVARHAIRTALAAVSLDAAYTLTFWLVLGRAERRAGTYPELRYFAILLQLSLEAAAIVHLAQALQQTKAAA